MPLPDDRQKFGAVLPLLFLLCFSIAIGLGLYALASLRAALVYERGTDLARTAAGAADTLDRILFERIGDIQAFADNRTLQEGSPDEITRKLTHYKKLYGYYSWIAVTDAAGRIVAATDRPLGHDKDAAPASSAARGQDFSRQDWFQMVRRTQQVHLGEAQRSPESGGMMAVAFSAPLLGPRGEWRGAVTTRMPLENFRSILEQEGSLRYGEDTYDWLLVDRRGLVISERKPAAAEDGNRRQSELPSAVGADADRRKSGFVEEWHARRQVAVLTGYARARGYGGSPGFDWTVLVRVDREQAYAPINRLVWMIGSVGLLVVAPLTGFGAWASWKLVREHRELARARQALEESLAELARSNHDLQQFAYVASHDLQEPLRMVASYTQLLARRYKSRLDADADEFITYAVDGAIRMQKLINDLLAYSRVQTQGKVFGPTDCQAVVERACANLRTLVDESRAVVTRDPLPVVMADEPQFLQLFQNLIGNAIKFRGEEPPHVHISAEPKTREWLFSIRDNGIGINPQYADRIFLLFQRLHSGAEYPGTGIGLALCKKIVERHGGRIWVESQFGKGATFSFTIPIHEANGET